MAQKSERIKEEESKCQAMADVAQADLDEALPALEEANRVSTHIFPRFLELCNLASAFEQEMYSLFPFCSELGRDYFNVLRIIANFRMCP